MDSCFASLKVSARPVPGGGIINRSVFWGENLRVGPINKQFGAQLCKSSRSKTRIGRVKPGIACSVLTSDIDKETTVWYMLHFSASPFFFLWLRLVLHFSLDVSTNGECKNGQFLVDDALLSVLLSEIYFWSQKISSCGFLVTFLELWFQTFQAPVLETPRADPKSVASIILGGGAGTRLFPLTSRRAKPAVSDYSYICPLHSTLSII